MGRQHSGDQEAWIKLSRTAGSLVEAESLQPALRVSSSGSLGWLVAPERGMSMDQLSVLLLSWLRELRDEYSHGNKAVIIRSVRDVLGCSASDACIHLGAANWDIESALRHHDLQTASNTLDALQACRPDCVGWSSHSAKLLRAERDCPICACDFGQGASERLVTRCCFKAICAQCVAVLTATSPSSEHDLICPFCRQKERKPELNGLAVASSPHVAELSHTSFQQDLPSFVWSAWHAFGRGLELLYSTRQLLVLWDAFAMEWQLARTEFTIDATWDAVTPPEGRQPPMVR